MKAIGRAVGAAVIVIAATVIDQATKGWALRDLVEDRVIPLGLGASLRLVFNPGVAFGIGADAGAPLVVGIMVLTAALTVWVIGGAFRGGSIPATVFLAVAAGGAIGNVWDRVTRAESTPLTGRVVDFIAVDWFAIFNVADIFTTVGIAGWAVLFVFRRSAPNDSVQRRAHTPLASKDV